MRSFHYRRLIFLLLLSNSALASPRSDALKTRVDAEVAKNFKNNSQVGLVVGIIRGSETYVWSYGEKVLGSGEAPTGDTFFEMGSITKTFTTTLLPLEVNRGKVRLNDPVHILWPELLGTDAGAITLEQLATHTSGLPRMPDNFAPSDPLNPYKDYDEQLLLAFLKGFRQKAAGPYPSSYSNVGMGLLGHLLSRKLYGLNYDTYLRNNLTGPLGLNDTKASLALADRPRAAQGYGDFFNLLPFWDLNVLAAAGVLKTTVTDLLKYVRFNLEADSSALGAAARLAQKPRASTDTPGVMIGLGWFSTKLGSHTVISHSGATGGYRSNLVFDQENKLGFVILSNTSMAPDCVGAPVFEIECQVPEWKAIGRSAAERLTGIYRSEPLRMTFRIFLENGLLGLEQDGTYKMRLWSKSETEFQLPSAGASFQFRLDDKGQAIGLMLVQEGQSYEFIRQE